jgi:hypothetical protein
VDHGGQFLIGAECEPLADGRPQFAAFGVGAVAGRAAALEQVAAGVGILSGGGDDGDDGEEERERVAHPPILHDGCGGVG